MYNYLWFHSLNKPFLNPPDWIFKPVWGLLYLMITTALVIYILSGCLKKGKGITLFVIQMILNLLWSPTFFLWNNIGLALIIILMLDVFVYLTIKEFYKTSKIAAILLVPYFVWIIFATYLNAGYFFLN